MTVARVREAAARNLTFLFRPLRGPTRDEFTKLDRWIPLLEKPAYRLCAKIVQVEEPVRRQPMHCSAIRRWSKWWRT